MYTVGSWTVKQGRENEFMAELESFGRWGRENVPGAMSVALLRDRDNASHFISIGEWKDMASVEAWRKTPEFAAFAGKINDLCEQYQLTNTEFALSVGSLRFAGSKEAAVTK